MVEEIGLLSKQPVYQKEGDESSLASQNPSSAQRTAKL